jgi:hypothetical protein
MHGMGPNQGDVPAMALLPELLYRFAFGSPYMRPLEFPASLPDGTPLLDKDTDWDNLLLKGVPGVPGVPPKFYQRVTRRIMRMVGETSHDALTWMPAARYSHFWPKMSAFALPSFYDGRVRINVAGREARGTVPAAEYMNVCHQIGDLIAESRNLLNGKPVVSEIYCPKQNPQDVGPSEADIYVVWDGAPLGFSHPRLGSIGPLPYRRTGGHTGRHGFLNIVGGDIPAGHLGLASSFDVVPTIIELLGQSRLPGVSGSSLVPQIVAVPSLCKECR